MNAIGVWEDEWFARVTTGPEACSLILAAPTRDVFPTSDTGLSGCEAVCRHTFGGLRGGRAGEAAWVGRVEGCAADVFGSLFIAMALSRLIDDS